jgi:hypothetical protein
VASRHEEIRTLRQGGSLASHRIVQMRSMGMHAIRFELVVRLLRRGLHVDTLSIYWEQGTEFMLRREVEDVKRRLVVGRGRRVHGEFPDLWLLCYPEDEEIRQSVEAVLDGMVERFNEDGERG